MYVMRTRRNVDESDGTVVFRLKKSTGVDKTIGYCLTKKWAFVKQSRWQDLTEYKPCLVISDLSASQQENHVEAIRSFIQQHRIDTLNVAGNRDDRSSGVQQFQQLVKQLLLEALSPVK